LFSNLDDDEEKEDGEFSSDDDGSASRKSVKTKRAKKDDTRYAGQDFSKLPFIDNNGLGYLPSMQYFPLQVDCPLTPANQLKPDESVTAIIHLNNGGFKCVALPLEALEEDE
jgi:hypothetical protein